MTPPRATADRAVTTKPAATHPHASATGRGPRPDLLRRGRASGYGSRRGGFTVRARLTVTFVALLAGALASMLVGVYLFMRYVPTYNFAGSTSASTTAPTTTTGTGTGRAGTDLTTGAVSVLITDRASVVATLLWISIGAAAALLLLGSAACWVLSGRLLGPLRQVNQAARLAASGTLDHRIQPTGRRDEITELGETFNKMLARLEVSFQRQQQFAANASHELQSPLTTTKALLDLAASADPSLVDITQLLGDLRALNDRSVATVDALLDLASSEHLDIERQPVDLAALASASITHHIQDHTSNRVDPHLERAVVSGDTALLRIMIDNLIANALHHASSPDPIHVDLRPGPGEVVCLTVTNPSSPMDEATLKMLLEPFARSSPRIAGADRRGRGLGLAIVAAVVQAHDGDLAITCVDGLFRVSASLAKIGDRPPREPASVNRGRSTW